MNTRIDPANLTPAMLKLMSPEDRARYRNSDNGVGNMNAVVVAAVAEHGSPSLTDHAEEQRLQGEIIGWLKDNGYEPGYSRMDKKSNLPTGWPDIFFAARNGRAVAFEVKTEHGRTSPDQNERIARMQGRHWTVEVVRSLQHAQDFLRQVEKER